MSDQPIGRIEQLAVNQSYVEYIAMLQRVGLGPALTEDDVRRIVREEIQRALSAGGAQ